MGKVNNIICNENNKNNIYDEDFDPYDTTGKYGQYGVCSRGVNYTSKFQSWCCIECERDRMVRRKQYKAMKNVWFENPMEYDFTPTTSCLDDPTKFNTDECFKDFSRKFTFIHNDNSVPLSLCWEMLGLIPPKTKQQIKKQFYELCRKHHPDKGGNHEKFIEIKQSYDKLICSF